MIDRALGDFLTRERLHGPGQAPQRLIGAMRHGTLNGGKRLRPLLVMQSAAIFSLAPDQVIRAALAVEMVHCYSLIHDDLPAMDDDDFRRGQPSVHKKFDEAAAILAGDALLTHAFEVLADPSSHPDPVVRTSLILELARGSGAAGMAGGQALDLMGEKNSPPENEIALMQKMKTGAVIRAAVRMGALLGGANDDQLAALTIYGQEAGHAFQLADDILDLTATSEQMGKATGKDAQRQKPTLVARIGLTAARRHLGDTIHNAISALMMFGPEANGLRATAKYFAEREN
ncbi:(2E,6E)-farnesyl diphosphate synthase [hydrothermal vent metagenome]|uniref:(2E,6E)-farnesyl diphosphate synthase n=1 Tax=hydrothermal vent metagenome TaxID=652676 RepID=A0A3B0TBU2_9ZZZZ